METAYWNDYYLKRNEKSSIESKDLSAACDDYYLKRKEKSSNESKDLYAACETFNSGNEINRKLKK